MEGTKSFPHLTLEPDRTSAPSKDSTIESVSSSTNGRHSKYKCAEHSTGLPSTSGILCFDSNTVAESTLVQSDQYSSKNSLCREKTKYRTLKKIGSLQYMMSTPTAPLSCSHTPLSLHNDVTLEYSNPTPPLSSQSIPSPQLPSRPDMIHIVQEEKKSTSPTSGGLHKLDLLVSQRKGLGSTVKDSLSQLKVAVCFLGLCLFFLFNCIIFSLLVLHSDGSIFFVSVFVLPFLGRPAPGAMNVLWGLTTYLSQLSPSGACYGAVGGLVGLMLGHLVKITPELLEVYHNLGGIELLCR